MDRNKNLSYFWLIALVSSILTAVVLYPSRPAFAYKAYTRSPVEAVISEGTVLAPTSGTTTSEAIQIGLGESYGMDWDLTSLSTNPSLNVKFLHSNSSSGPFRQWTNPSKTNHTFTTDVTITTKEDGTDLDLTHSNWIKLQLTNTDSSTLTIDRLGLFNQ